MNDHKFFILIALAVISHLSIPFTYADIPLPEHPRPDFWRGEWKNLNGNWQFRFDAENAGEREQWFNPNQSFSREIIVPFSWGAPLSGIEDEADIGWYKKKITIPDTWKDKRIFLVVGASDWLTRGWIDDHFIGENRGGYTPFELELTPFARFGEEQMITLRVDDSDHPFKLEGKQGYGKARGIWQTIYLEARGQVFIDHVHISPNIDDNTITIDGKLEGAVERRSTVNISLKGEQDDAQEFEIELIKQSSTFRETFELSHPRLWTLNDPHLYDVSVTLDYENGTDNVNTYFGMRKISIGDLPGTEYSYVTLNNQPIYLQLALDQAYHPEGYYTFPSDAFIRDEIIRSKKIGLNGQRVHVKIGIPRKLYWADRLGMLIMADVPNSWGEPDEEMRSEIEKALRDMIKRDYNHPSIFSWVIFNETWGLLSREENGNRAYLPETKEWVTDMYHLAKSLDPTRLVEDNSANRRDHVVTDLNTWHAYLPGYEWKEFLEDAVDNTYEGSGWNFSEGYVQGRQPMLNSECGNVWGYQGSTGDVDWSWDYHMMINAFRLHPEVAGWLYTEHHDVINEWNGYYKYDRSEKYTGLESFNGMTLNDLHHPIQLTPDIDLMTEVRPEQEISIPVWLSVLTSEVPFSEAEIVYHLNWVNDMGMVKEGVPIVHQSVAIKPWQMAYTEPISITAPPENGLLTLNLELRISSGKVIHHNFVVFRVAEDHQVSTRMYSGEGEQFTLLSFAPNEFSDSQWSEKKWEVLDGKKVNGAGTGYFEYALTLPDDLEATDVRGAVFRVELSAKQLFGKDMDDSGEMIGDYMRGRGTHDPSRNPNAYPMTDEEKHPSFVRIKINEEIIHEAFLEDDPADHRGVLSWHAQLRDGKLREAGSYGYLITASIPGELLESILEEKILKLTIEVPDILPGGVAIYGKEFGRYPLDPTFIFQMN